MTTTKISDGFETFTTPASAESFIAEDFFSWIFNFFECLLFPSMFEKFIENLLSS